jgi:hypothetical protein
MDEKAYWEKMMSEIISQAERIAKLGNFRSIEKLEGDYE